MEKEKEGMEGMKGYERTASFGGLTIAHTHFTSHSDSNCLFLVDAAFLSIASFLFLGRNTNVMLDD
jgi:hypothetical protein